MEKIITLTTDFGLKDPYQGAMKGAILSVNPFATIVDITQLISPGDILEGAIALLDAYEFFPRSTIHLGVVDPGVGSRRAPVLIETERYFFIGPDNGLFSLAAGKDRIRRVIKLTARKYFSKEISDTFHGRDIFGPVAAHLSLGVDPKEFGEVLDAKELKTVEVPVPRKRKSLITGEIIHIDSFGNLLTNVKKEDVIKHKGILEVEVNGSYIKGLKKTYSDSEKGRPVAIISSSGNLEIAVNLGTASVVLKAKVGDKVNLRFLKFQG